MKRSRNKFLVTKHSLGVCLPVFNCQETLLCGLKDLYQKKRPIQGKQSRRAPVEVDHCVLLSQAAPDEALKTIKDVSLKGSSDYSELKCYSGQYVPFQSRRGGVNYDLEM